MTRCHARMSAVSLAGSALLLAACASSRPPDFASPQAAVDALAAAVRTDTSAALVAVLGPEATEIVNSGDPVEDAQKRAHFLELYDQGHRVVAGPEAATLLIGSEDWPFPLPLDQRDGRWAFDVDAGREEIINRRVGSNELDTIETCRAMVDAQHEYRELALADKPRGDYAQRFVASQPAAGHEQDPPHDGLFWHTAPGRPLSPLGELAAEARAEGYSRSKDSTASQPYHGYLYEMLTSQGRHAPGGAMDYLVDGHLVRGFAVLAFPVDYGSSGVMSFLVGANGIVYESDLGPETATRARAISAYDPDPSWVVSD